MYRNGIKEAIADFIRESQQGSTPNIAKYKYYA